MLQSEALDILKLGKNVFLTGPAGSGKTYVLNEYVQYLKSHGVDVAVTASTGIASTHLGGMTIHSWSGLGIRSTLSDYDIDDLMQKAYLYKRYERTKVLIIDEISMLHHYRLDLIEWICRQFKRNEKPFGGMQVIFSGDFFQLPPVTRGDLNESEYAYKAKSWQSADLVICHLSEQHRQKDKTYLSILNEIRSGEVSGDVVDLLKTRFNAELEAGVEPTRLYTHNIDVDIINNRHLGLVSGNPRQYEMTSRGSRSLVESLKKSCLSPEKLVLKAGARVMFTKNDPEGKFVNGTLGVVDGFDNFGAPIVKTYAGMKITTPSASWQIEEEGKVKAEVSQYPLRLAWAITVHKSQGLSLDAMEVDLSKSFVRGMGYVALSRVRTLHGMKLLGFNDMSLEVDPEVLEKDRAFKIASEKAARDLHAMSKEEKARKQKAYLSSIEPEEKIKIKRKEKLMKKSTEEITADLLREEMPLSAVAEKRGLKAETIISHIEKLIEDEKCPDIDYLRRELKRSELDTILDVFRRTGTTTLSPIYNILSRQKKNPSYLKLRLARLFL